MRLIDADALWNALNDAGGTGAEHGSWADGWDKAIEEAICLVEKAPAVEPAQQWIPVTDRLPEIHNTVLVFARYNGQSANTMRIKHDAITTNFRDSRGEWIYMGKGYRVEAWMPLPEPYIPAEEGCK